jgi:putative spermidine/putrescine transport system substrate-binding protein
MTHIKKTGVSRRTILAAGAASASVFAMPSILSAEERSLKVGVYGGYFKKSFDKNIFPEFTKATGIKVESVAEPTGEAWLVQLEQAARANRAPADVSMMSQVSLLKGQSTKLWAPLDMGKIPNSKNLLETFINKYPDGGVAGIGAVSWYVNLVSNTKVIKEAPKSWAAMWDNDRKDQLGLLALVSNSFLLEVTAKTFFGGTAILDTEEGILKVMDKLAELKDNVRLWYRDEAQFEQGLKTGEIPMGQYYHDVTGLAVADGHPVRSTFPKEGGILDSGSWALSRASSKSAEAHEFINFMCLADVQSNMSRKVGTAPTVKTDLLTLTAEEFASVSSEIDPILPRYDMYLKRSDWLNQKWTELIVG